jgi:hypothetical protein
MSSPRPDEEEPYALPCHPLDLGEDGPRALCGFAREGRTEPGDVDADATELHGFRVRDANGPGPAGREAEPGQAGGAVGPPRFHALGPGGSLTERDSLQSDPTPRPTPGHAHLPSEAVGGTGRYAARSPGPRSVPALRRAFRRPGRVPGARPVRGTHGRRLP